MKKIEPPLKPYTKDWFQEQINTGQAGLTELARKLAVSTTAIKKKLHRLGLQPMEKTAGWPLIREFRRFKRRPVNSWVKDTMVDSRKGLKAIKTILGQDPCLSPMVVRALVRKYCVRGDMVLEPFAWSGNSIFSVLAEDCSYNGIVHSPEIYTNLQKLAELMGSSKVNISYEEMKPMQKANLIIGYIPGPPVIKKKCRLYVSELFKMAEKNLTDGGHLAIQIPGWVKVPETGLTEIEQLKVVSAYDPKGTRPYIIRTWKK